ncbi:MAG: DUF2617 family protein [bacterium]|nr:DUF2617 family protein [bacterium]
MLTVRPKVAQLSFQLYGRSLHPELFHTFQTRLIERDAYQAELRITSAGHWISWRYKGFLLSEIAASAQQPLPKRRRLLKRRFSGAREDQIDCRGGATYQIQYTIERAEPETFCMFQKELVEMSERQGMLQTFDSSGRMALGALSYIYFEARRRSARVQAFHTFPDDYAIVKTQSLFELPES